MGSDSSTVALYDIIERSARTRLNTTYRDSLQSVSIAKRQYGFHRIPIGEQRQQILKYLCVDADTASDVLDITQVDEETRAALVSALTDLPDVVLGDRYA